MPALRILGACAHRVESRGTYVSGHSLPTRAASGLVAFRNELRCGFRTPVGPSTVAVVGPVHVACRVVGTCVCPQPAGQRPRRPQWLTAEAAAVATDRTHTRPPAAARRPCRFGSLAVISAAHCRWGLFVCLFLRQCRRVLALLSNKYIKSAALQALCAPPRQGCTPAPSSIHPFSCHGCRRRALSPTEQRRRAQRAAYSAA